MAGAVAEPRKGQAGCAHHAPRRLREHRSFLGSDGAAWPALSTLKRVMGDEKAFRSYSPEESPPSWLLGLKSYLRHLCRVRVIAPARPATKTLISHGPSSRYTASAEWTQPSRIYWLEKRGGVGVGRTSPPSSRGLKEVGNHSDFLLQWDETRGSLPSTVRGIRDHISTWKRHSQLSWCSGVESVQNSVPRCREGRGFSSAIGSYCTQPASCIRDPVPLVPVTTRHGGRAPCRL